METYFVLTDMHKRHTQQKEFTPHEPTAWKHPLLPLLLLLLQFVSWSPSLVTQKPRKPSSMEISSHHHHPIASPYYAMPLPVKRQPPQNNKQ